MTALLFVLWAIGFAWLLVRLNQTRDELGTLRALLDRLDLELSQLKQRTAEEPPPARGFGTPTATDITPAPPKPDVQPPEARRPIPTPPAAVPPPIPPELIQPTPVFARATFPSHESLTAASELPGIPPLTTSAPSESAKRSIEAREPLVNWERFMGAKLFAWLGGFALFLGVAFFVKYSFDHNLVPAEVRVALGFITGLGLLTGGVVLKRREYAVTAQTLCATGILILYAVSFACHSFYHFTGAKLTFALMVAVTGAAFLLAVQMEARVVAVLGLAGGFVTPLLLSTGQDQALALFTYIALLDAGLVAVALHRRWHFLVLLGGGGHISDAGRLDRKVF